MKTFSDDQWPRRLETSIVETVRALRDDAFDGFFSLEPHLGKYTEFGALSGPELFTRAWRAFTDILKREGIPYA